MKIAHKISVSFLITALLVTCIAVAVIYCVAKDKLEDAIFAHLRTAAESRAHHIETLLEKYTHEVELVANSLWLEEVLETINNKHADSTKLIETAVSELEEVLYPETGLYEVFVLKPNGEIVVSTDRGKIGLDKSAEAYFLGGRNQTYIKDVYYSETTKRQTMAISAPIRNDQTGELLGVLVARYSLESLYEITTDRTGLGQTGEIYLVNKDNLMISPSRFIEDTFLKQEIGSQIIGHVKYHGNELHRPYEEVNRATDYRGVDVIGIHEHIAQMQWALIAEIDKKEALAPLRAIKVLVAAMLLCVPTVAWLVGTFMSKVIARPILKLQAGTEVIGSGNLDYKVATDSNDEIGQLSRAFDKMTESLKKTTTSISNLEKEVAERKKAQDALNREKAFTEFSLNTLQDIFYVFAFEGKCLRWNRSLSTAIGYSDEEIASMKPTDYFTGEDAQRIADALEQIRKEGFAKVEANMITKDGKSIPYELTGSLLQDSEGNAIGFCGVGRDISERKKAEQALQAVNDDLALTAEQLEDSNRELQDFAYIASHDLREPLRKISSFGGLLKDSLGEKLDSDDQENLGYMVNGADRMNQMIEGLLIYSRLSRKEVSFETVDLNEIVKQLEQFELAAIVEETKATIEVPQPLPKVWANPTQMSQLLQNLIANGIKYRREDCPPRIVITAQQTVQETLRIEVQDNGIGLKEEFYKDIFTMFRRLHSRKKYEGTGIGLAVCKKIVEKHGGQIGVESSQGQGATFWFTIPLANQTQEAVEQLQSVIEK